VLDGMRFAHHIVTPKIQLCSALTTSVPARDFFVPIEASFKDALLRHASRLCRLSGVLVLAERVCPEKRTVKMPGDVEIRERPGMELSAH
jgi:hypothetical protein